MEQIKQGYRHSVAAWVFGIHPVSEVVATEPE